MYLSFEWLNDYLDLTGLTGEALADRMSRTGIEIEAVENYGTQLSGLVVGQVLSVEDHADSDHLHVCQVTVGDQEPLQIVCGAPNVVAGAKVIVATIGARLSGGLKIKKGKLRGVESHGMLCALQELGFPDSVVPKVYAEGLFLLPADAPIGADVVEYLKLDDPILELSITPNRADALSMRGAAYEVGAIIDQVPNFDNIHRQAIQAADTALLSDLTVKIADGDLSACYQARVIDQVEIKESPLWLQMRLMKAGVRPHNNIVDITNYFLMLYGQPLHAFDYDTLEHKTLGVRPAREGEVLVTLDGSERHLSASDLVITDQDRAVALAGVMGGLDTEVTDKTRRVLLESAVFNPIAIRQTSKKFNLRSESSMRFEKGINHATISEAGQEAANWMAYYSGGQVVPGLVEENHLDLKPVEVTVPYRAIQDKIGIDLSHEELSHIFRRLGFELTLGQDSFTVTVPKRRWDISIESDILEEVARIYGYDNLPTTLPVVPSTPGRLNAKQKLVRQTRSILEGLGLNQVISYVLTSPKQADLMKSKDYPVVALDFPMSEDRSVLRQSLFPALLEIAKYNAARQNPSLAFYETGKVFYGQGSNVQPLEQERLAILLSGVKESKSWYGPAQSYDFFDLKGALEGYLAAIRLDKQVSFQAVSTYPELHPGRTAQVLLGDQVIGVMGQIHPVLAKSYDLDEASFFAELDFDAILAVQRPALVQRPIPKYPSTSRDLALLVDLEQDQAGLAQLMKEHGGDNLVSVELFDLFINLDLFRGKKSLAYRLIFQNPDKTLTDEDVQSAMDRIRAALETVSGLEIR